MAADSVGAADVVAAATAGVVEVTAGVVGGVAEVAGTAVIVGVIVGETAGNLELNQGIRV